MDTLNVTQFTAVDALKMMGEQRERVDQVNIRLHAQVVRLIRNQCERRLNFLTYRLPVSMFGYPGYSPDNSLRWLFRRLTDDGFRVLVRPGKRELRIEWGSSGKPAAKKKTTRTRKKSVSFGSDNLFHFYP